MTLVGRIAEWTTGLPSWQSDALRRCFLQDRLSDEDESDLLKMLLAAHGIVDKENPPPEAVPFSTSSQLATPLRSQIILNELHSVVGVNALIADQSITFALEGLTVVYGENGAGKSGYSRVLKHSCHAREQNEPILSDVRAKQPPSPSAVIELTVDEADIAVNWTKGMVPSTYLLEIAVFDSHCARVFLDDANEVVYLPHGVSVFPKLVDCMRRLKEKIKARSSAIPSRLAVVDEFSASTTTGIFVRNLTASSDPLRVDVFAHLDAKSSARLSDLRKLVSTAKINPPKEQALQLRRRKSRLEQLKLKVDSVDAGLSPDAVTNLKQLQAASAAADEAEKLASAGAFQNEPIPNTGSAAWKLLFDAARTFSTTEAYPDETFPYVGESAACVLCQQPLESSAKERMARFEAFVSNTAARAKEQAREAFRKAEEAANGLDVSVLDDDPTYTDDLRAVSEDLAAKTQEYFAAAKSRKNAIANFTATYAWKDAPAFAESVSGALAEQMQLLEASAADFEKADDPAALKKLEEELAELADRERAKKYAADIKSFIEEKKKEASLKQCESALDTGAVTRFSSDLVAKAVTEDLEQCLTNELTYFSVHNLPLKLKKSGDKGKTRHQLTITSDARPSGVLSEGEQRVVAIACFLAELAAVKHSSPIIFDDPVSSLDHVYRGKVAARLAAEAAERQVVVFTHDITLLLALERECAENQVPLLAHTVRRAVGGPGECTAPGMKPWHCQTTTDRIKYLRNACAPFKKLEASEPESFEREAKEVYALLREAWERAIEEVVLNGVVTRFDPSIQTKRLKGICLEAADYATIDTAMGKCSTMFAGHDTAPALAAVSISAEELSEDIELLDSFVKAMKKKQETARKDADELIKPPTARVAGKRAADKEKLIA